ncbi:porin [Rufibacter hautae]|uniref:Porin n=1 Tax=Rufibacter hautae TaxID=2595005 RepID=A0A5B6TSI2_9BACT|nr:porin [Rufibacter hautae]KAA3439438.1 porin [Rufibacter hautae]
MRKIYALTAATFFAAAKITIAQEISSVDTLKAVVEEPTPSKGTFNLSGYVDAFYQYNLNRPESGKNQGRVFDQYHDNISLGLIQTLLTYKKDKATAVVDLTFGPNADLCNFGNSGTAKIIKQAYVSYDFTDKFRLTVGQYATHIGYELIDAPLNYNYSLSYLFGNGPFYHTGAKLDYTVNPKLGLMLGVINGWDCLNDLNDQKSVTAQVHLTPLEGFGMYLNWIGGDEYNTLSNFGGNKGSYTSLFDLTTSYQLTPKFKLGLNAAYGSFYTGADTESSEDIWSIDATWGGGALYASYELSSKFGLGFRGEYFSDPEGVRYFGPLEVTSYTMTGNIKLAGGNFLVKPEVRFDKAKDAFFENAAGQFSKKTQTTVGAAFVYSFSMN